MKRICLSVVLALTFVVGLAAQETQVEFEWAFAKQVQGDSIVALDFKERVAIVPGDLFKKILLP
jgi:hypothetical protein